MASPKRRAPRPGRLRAGLSRESFTHAWGQVRWTSRGLAPGWALETKCIQYSTRNLFYEKNKIPNLEFFSGSLLSSSRYRIFPRSGARFAKICSTNMVELATWSGTCSRTSPLLPKSCLVMPSIKVPLPVNCDRLAKRNFWNDSTDWAASQALSGRFGMVRHSCIQATLPASRKACVHCDVLLNVSHHSFSQTLAAGWCGAGRCLAVLPTVQATCFWRLVCCQTPFL